VSLSRLIKQHQKVYDVLAAEYERNIPNYYDSTKEAIEILYRSTANGTKVLDVGCGSGLATKLLLDKGLEVTAIDLSPKMVEYAKERNPAAHIIQGDFLNYPFAENFDAVIALAFIHLFPKDIATQAFVKISNLLKPSGLLYVGTTKSEISREGWELKQDAFFPKSIEKRYRKHWTVEELEVTLQQSGFKIKELHLIEDPRNKTWMDFLAIKS